MTDSDDPPASDWIQQWIEQQRVLLQRRSQEQGAAGADEQTRRQLLELGTKWLEVGQAYLTSLEQFATGGVAGAERAAAAAQSLGEQFLNAWQGQWQSLSNAAARPEGAQMWAEWLRQIPPIGLAREHQASLKELADLQAQCQRLEQSLRATLYQVQLDALNLLEQRVRERQAAAGTLGFRELYDLWIECGEQAYAPVAHSDAYCQLQAQLGNATLQLRARQQKLVEQALRHFDLPTRSELDTVHRQLRDQARLLRELQAQLTAIPARNVRQSGTRARSRGTPS